MFQTLNTFIWLIVICRFQVNLKSLPETCDKALSDDLLQKLSNDFDKRRVELNELVKKDEFDIRKKLSELRDRVKFQFDQAISKNFEYHDCANIESIETTNKLAEGVIENMYEVQTDFYQSQADKQIQYFKDKIVWCNSKSFDTCVALEECYKEGYGKLESLPLELKDYARSNNNEFKKNNIYEKVDDNIKYVDQTAKECEEKGTKIL